MTRKLASTALIVLGLVASSRVQAAAPVVVEPGELTQRPELIGREVIVDDRVARFQIHPGKGFDEIWLKRAAMPFRLPPKLRFQQSPGAPAVKLQGVLKKEGDLWACDVTNVELMPKDIDRLNQGVAVLSPGDFERRNSWANWAEKRGHDFQDKELLTRGRALLQDAIRIEADRPLADPAKQWLELARRARSREIPEPEPSALAHRAFRRRLRDAKSVDDLRSLRTDVEEMLPKASLPNSGHNVDVSRWEATYGTNPAEGYRTAPSAARGVFDHRLWADTMQELLVRQAAADPKEAITLAEEAANQLPDRPAIAEQLLEVGIKEASTGLGTLRLGEVETLAKLYSDRLRQPERGKALLRDWLDDQRNHKLSPTDAEGRVGLASQYESLVGDRATAIELLQAAWKIDPQSSETADAFRRRGFRKVNDEWVANPKDATASKSAATTEEAPAVVASPRRQPLKGKTAQEVRSLLGKPNRIIFSASQGQLIEQWVYASGNLSQYVNFVRSGSDTLPTVISHTSLAKSSTSIRP